MGHLELCYSDLAIPSRNWTPQHIIHRRWPSRAVKFNVMSNSFYVCLQVEIKKTGIFSSLPFYSLFVPLLWNWLVKLRCISSTEERLFSLWMSVYSHQPCKLYSRAPEKIELSHQIGKENIMLTHKKWRLIMTKLTRNPTAYHLPDKWKSFSSMKRMQLSSFQMHLEYHKIHKQIIQKYKLHSSPQSIRL